MGSAGYVSWFADIGLGDRPHVGGKGGSLGELQRAGIAVPPGFVVRTQAFERFLEALERETPVRAQVQALQADDLAAVIACAAAVRARVEEAELPKDVLDELAMSHEMLCRMCGAPNTNESMDAVAVAVRSSATTEDSADASFAGLQDTYLWVM